MIHPTGHNGGKAPKESQRTAVDTAFNTEAEGVSETAPSNSPVLPEIDLMNKTVVNPTDEVTMAPVQEAPGEISTDLIQKVRGHLRSMTLEDSEQITEIRGRIQEGNYSVPSDTIAADIIRTLRGS